MVGRTTQYIRVRYTVEGLIDVRVRTSTGINCIFFKFNCAFYPNDSRSF